MEQLIAKKQYSQALEAMLKMKEPVDSFFDEVMVMADDHGSSDKTGSIFSLAWVILFSDWGYLKTPGKLEMPTE